MSKKFDKQVAHGKSVASRSFSEVFRSMQLLNICVLYYDFDFDKEMIKAYNDKLKSYNNECLDSREAFMQEEERLMREYKFSCEDSAKEITTTSKMNMIGFKPKTKTDWYIALANGTDAIESCLVLFLHEFINVVKPSEGDVALWWRCMKRYAEECYSNGMKDEFVVKYFKDQIDLNITW